MGEKLMRGNGLSSARNAFCRFAKQGGGGARGHRPTDQALAGGASISPNQQIKKMQLKAML